MSENDEIEAKIILPKEIYQQLCTAFPSKSSFDQQNYYFDTDDGLLKKAKMSCRIRLYHDHAEQTLKVPKPMPRQHTFHEARELNDNLTLKSAQKLVKLGQEHRILSFQGAVGNFLKQYFGPELALQLQTYSKTHRTLAYGPKDCELTFDANTYPDNYQDYELEIENSNPQLISDVLHNLKQNYGIKQTPANTNQAKIGRAFTHSAKI